MDPTEEILEKVRDALASEPLVGAQHGISLALADGDLTMEGEVATVAAKKLALECAAAVPGVAGIVDRVRVAPASRMGDAEIRAELCQSLAGEPVFADCTIEERRADKVELYRDAPAGAVGRIEVAVEDGVVTLNGALPSLARKRLAGVLAWWLPGSRDVINGIAVEPPEEDNAYEIEEAVRIALEKDPFVDAGQVKVGVDGAVVRLTGLVPTESERDMAGFDAWYVFGVDRVINEIEVHA